mgnify:CR=1 FL=1
MLWSVKRAPPLFFQSVECHTFVQYGILFLEYRIYIIYFCFVVTVIARFYLCDFGQIIIVLFRKFIKRDFIVYFKIVGNCSLINSVTFFYCMTGVFYRYFLWYDIFCRYCTIFGGGCNNFYPVSFCRDSYLKGIRYPAGLGSGELFSVFHCMVSMY